jgi:hypothetical protein|tara:strand:- start:898 stop:1044 length:147 start_codon:yes stop_codon:yes gene_type:complete
LDARLDVILSEIYWNMLLIEPWNANKAPIIAIEIRDAIKAYSIDVAPL